MTKGGLGEGTAAPPPTWRVLVTRDLPGQRWREILAQAGCRVDLPAPGAGLSPVEIAAALAGGCHAVIGQLTEPWGADLLAALRDAGGKVYANYAVGYDNVDVAAATALGLSVGNTPGVLTETTAEMAVALTFAAARRIAEADAFTRAGRFHGWEPTLLLGELLHGKTLGVVGAGRIGAAYARMLVEGHRMHLLYHDPRPNPELEERVRAYGVFLASRGEAPVRCRRCADLDELLGTADVVSLHTALDATTRHLLDARRLGRMRGNAVLVNTSRGAVLDEAALVAHCRSHPEFRVGLDVYEREPALAPGLTELPNVVLAPHIASASRWTREGMAILAACNVAAVLRGDPVWSGADVTAFLGPAPPRAAPSIVNGAELGMERR